MRSATASSRLSTRPLPLWTQASIIATAIGFGLLASYPTWFALATGIVIACALGIAGEFPLLSIAILFSGVSFSFLGEVGVASAGNLDAFRLALVLGGFAVASLKNPSLLRPAEGLLTYAAFLFYSALATAWSPSAGDGLKLWLKLLYPAVIYLLTRQVLMKHGERAVVTLLGLGVGIAAAWNVAIWLSGLSPYVGAGYAGRFAGASHPNTIGLLCGAAGLILYAAGGRSRTAATGAVICVAQLVATGSRTALLAAGVGISVFEGLSGRWRRAVFLGVLGVCIWAFLPAFGQRTSEAGADIGLAPFGSGLNLSGRLILWGDVWAALMGDAQWVGRGLGATDVFMSSRYAGLKSVHSGYLLVLVDLGFTGLLLLLAFYIPRYIKNVGVALTRMQGPTPAMSAGLVAMFLVASITESTFAGYAFPSLVWIGIGMSDHQQPRAAVT